MKYESSYDIRNKLETYVNQKIYSFFTWLGLIILISVIVIIMCNFYYVLGYTHASNRAIQIIMGAGLK